MKNVLILVTPVHLDLMMSLISGTVGKFPRDCPYFKQLRETDFGSLAPTTLHWPVGASLVPVLSRGHRGRGYALPCH